jgi:hypothetical protein
VVFFKHSSSIPCRLCVLQAGAAPCGLHYHSRGGIKCCRKTNRMWRESFVQNLLLSPGYMMRSILAATCTIPVSFVNKEGPICYMSPTRYPPENRCLCTQARVHRTTGCAQKVCVLSTFAIIYRFSPSMPASEVYGPFIMK